MYRNDVQFHAAEVIQGIYVLCLATTAFIKVRDYMLAQRVVVAMSLSLNFSIKYTIYLFQYLRFFRCWHWYCIMLYTCIWSSISKLGNVINVGASIFSITKWDKLHGWIETEIVATSLSIKAHLISWNAQTICSLCSISEKDLSCKA
jgi:hypothetical protein